MSSVSTQNHINKYELSKVLINRVQYKSMIYLCYHAMRKRHNQIEWLKFYYYYSHLSVEYLVEMLTKNRLLVLRPINLKAH